MKKIPAVNTAEMSPDVPSQAQQRNDSRMSWQDTCWDDMETTYEINNNKKASRRPSRRSSHKSELTSSSSSFYQSLAIEVEAEDELPMKEISDSSTEVQQPPIIRTKRKSMQKCLEEDEEAFANSLRLLALEVKKKKEKDASILCGMGTSI